MNRNTNVDYVFMVVQMIRDTTVYDVFMIPR